MPFRFSRLALPEVLLVEPRVFPDQRGFFMETYKYSEFCCEGIGERFVQENHSHSAQGTLRGLHYQRLPKAQGKLIRVVVGEVFDVVIDIRKKSPRYGQWLGMTLSAENKQMLYVPQGFAHGFCVISEEAGVLYMVTEEYSPELEAGIIWNDPDIAISWPLEKPILSERDRTWPRLRDAENNCFYCGNTESLVRKQASRVGDQ